MASIMWIEDQKIIIDNGLFFFERAGHEVHMVFPGKQDEEGNVISLDDQIRNIFATHSVDFVLQDFRMNETDTRDAESFQLFYLVNSYKASRQFCWLLVSAGREPEYKALLAAGVKLDGLAEKGSKLMSRAHFLGLLERCDSQDLPEDTSRD